MSSVHSVSFKGHFITFFIIMEFHGIYDTHMQRFILTLKTWDFTLHAASSALHFFDDSTLKLDFYALMSVYVDLLFVLKNI